MLPGMEMMGCQDLAVPAEVMRHVVQVESSFNPYAIGVVGGRLVRQPKTLAEALSTARMLEEKGYNFSLGLAQVNRYNLARYGLSNYERAFQSCPNLKAGARILAECHGRAGGDWGKAFSCYYSGNFTTGFRHGYVQKVYASMRRQSPRAASGATPIGVVGRSSRHAAAVSAPAMARSSLIERRGSSASSTVTGQAPRPASEAPSPVATAAQPAVVQPGPAPASPSPQIQAEAAATVRPQPVKVQLVGGPVKTSSPVPVPPAQPQVGAATVVTGEDKAFVF